MTSLVDVQKTAVQEWHKDILKIATEPGRIPPPPQADINDPAANHQTYKELISMGHFYAGVLNE